MASIPRTTSAFPGRSLSSGLAGFRDTALLIAASILALLVIAVLFPGLFTGRDPLASNMSNALAAPSFEHIFGTDHLGRDVWSRVVHGARYSILIGVASTALAVVIGVLLGLIAGVSHRRVDEAISRVFDAVGAFPDLLFALMLITLIGPGTGNVIAAIAIASAPRYGRVVRAETLRVRESDYVVQSRLAIASATRRTFRHVLPNALGTVPVLATLGIGTAIIGAAGLSFLGFGPTPPLPEWGSMLSDARQDLRIAWWVGFFPGLFITITVVSVSIAGRNLQRRFERRAQS
ncbi:ABC transporter permease [Mycolicibacterium parafortuitum]|uniref:Binding-protein-dependent transporter inner membrane component [Thermobispora bispora DSM] n=1 Tax=Mycolicibacterium parafortuitum TaxID=39692 RepID=A0A375YGF6_MYCPF|nr:ABC transporter permease [Mycolicibacterium parafortuitum]ORB25866.1 peptide ABC transporter permease [Mycolicibacterium parafortuitum]SRX80207.1 binding-protein-dependent transporter inner membrane component [Thermobispora bispora DSM] [Mycolicibacterium parafortuitum]